MPNTAKNNPRKLPQQGRSRDTVETLLEATCQVLVEHGFDKTSTNKIAIKAGVSIGSLYQYFPNKEALVAEVLRRHYNEMSDICARTFEQYWDAPLATIIQETIKAMVAVHAAHPELHALLEDQVPTVGQLGNLMELHRETELRIRDLLAAKQSETRVLDLDLAAFVVVETVDGLLHAWLKPHPKVWNKVWNQDLITAEIARVVWLYLAKNSGESSPE